PYAKGGDYSPFYDDIHLLVNWSNNGLEIKTKAKEMYHTETRTVKCQEYYLREGLTYPLVTVKGINVRVLPKGCICDNGGPGIFAAEHDSLWKCLGVVNSRLFQFILNSLTTSRHWQVGYVSLVPYSQIDSRGRQLAKECCMLRRSLNEFDETTNEFCHFALSSPTEEMRGRAVAYRNSYVELDQVVAQKYGFKTVPKFIESYLGDLEIGKAAKKCFQGMSDQEWVSSMLSYVFGIVVGRWDVRIAKNPSFAPKSPDPFLPLPVCSPGMLVGEDGFPARPGGIVSKEWLRTRPDANTLPPEGSLKNPTIFDSEYPIAIAWDGILVDDPDHPYDVIRRVMDVLAVILKDGAEAIEEEVREILRIKELREYFRKPGNDGFWIDHVKRYSKSRRKAPIYWLLQSIRGNYAVWLYYHRLTKDTLFKVIKDFVEPKIQFERNRLKEIKQKYDVSKSSGHGLEERKLANATDQQEKFLEELNRFRNDIQEVADRGYDPDLNDGVIINIAPFHKIIPWKEPAKIWKELEAGGYDWSHMAMKLWPERVKEKCKKDKSLAIAHGLDKD
ncbi:MAG: SAM-dependent methyltransferase, partial [Candidatus Hodarchaeota archaeon]